jgi:hypothetical protein
MFQTKVVENIKTHVLRSILCHSENRAVYEKIWGNVERDRPRMTIWRMRFACCTAKAKDINAEYVILLMFHCNNVARTRLIVTL